MKAIENAPLWERISDEVREYLSIRYFGKTRCCLNEDEIDTINRFEAAALSIHNN